MTNKKNFYIFIFYLFTYYIMVDNTKSKHMAVFDGKLENAEKYKVVTRFPPEPSGYLHIGHIKAVILNRHLADLYEGKMVIRFDDTNPDKESMEFAENILVDLKTAKVDWTGEPDYCSNHFEKYEEIMTRLITEGKCYCDNTDVETMRDQRDKGIPSKCREQSVEENLEIWNKMRDKSITKDSLVRKYVVRGKFPNIKDKNKCMRDPVFYRFVDGVHYRLGDKYKLYPTYDFVCPIADNMCNVTHLLRTNEYADRIPMYRWVEQAIGLPTINIYEYSRLNLSYTVLSKRKLKWFVENGHVDGWDDPRFPTLRGILRRGVTIEAIKDFMLTIGPSKNTNLMSWDRIYAINKDHIDPVAKRLFAVSADSNVLVEIDNFNEDEEVVVDWHPKNKELGVRKQFRSNRLLIETEDSKDLEIDTKLTLYKWGNSRITKLEKDENGQLKKIHLRLTPEDQDFKKTKVAHWISNKEGHYIKVKGVEFDHIITKEKPEEEDKIEDIINPNSKIEYDLFVEPIIESIIEKTSIQFERRGYYYVDKAMSDKQTAVLHYIPDGKSKSMSVIGTKVDLKTLTGAKDDGKSKKQEKKKEKTEKVQTEEEKQKAKEAIEKKKKQKEEVENK